MSISVKVAGTEYAGAVDPTSVQATQMANDGEAGFGGFAIDDPGADVLTVGHKAVTIEESECSQPRLFTGWTTQRDMGRSGERGMIVADDRLHDVTLVDLNAAVRFRILRGSDCKRPEESMDERMAWIIGKPALTQFVTNFDAVETGYSREMDEADYRGMTPGDVLDDILQREIVDLTYFVYWDPAAEEVALYFGPQSTATTESTLSISNVLADVDGSTVFFPDSEAKLARKPDQVYSQVMLVYREGTRRVFRERESTATAYVDRGAKIDRPRVKKAATAQSQAERWLTAHAEEIDTITVTIIVPAASAGLAVAGQRIDVKFSHLPSYTDWTSMRIVQSTITPTTDVASHYAVTLELENPALGGEPPEPEPESSGIALLFSDSGCTTDDYPRIVMYTHLGDSPPMGWDSYATTGFVEAVECEDEDENPGYYGVRILGNGIVSVEHQGAYSGVSEYGDTTTWAIRLNGDVISSGTFTDNVAGWGHSNNGVTYLLVEDLPVNAGDIIDTYVTQSGWAVYYYRKVGGVWNPSLKVWGDIAEVDADTTEDLEEAPLAPVESGVDPTVDDDADDGYLVGQPWINVSSGGVFILADNSAGAAEWVKIPRELNDLAEVSIVEPADGDVLTWDDYAGEWVALPSATGVAWDTIWDAKGDLAVGSGADAASRLAVGTDGYVLTADSSATYGVKWGAASGGASWTPPTPIENEGHYENSSTTNAVTVSSPTAGNVVLMFIGGTSRGADSITQTNVTWTNRFTSNGNSQYVEVWVGVVAASAGTTATVNFASNTRSEVRYVEYASGDVPSFTSAGTPNTVTASNGTFCGISPLSTAADDWVVWVGSGNAASSSYSFLSQPYAPIGNFGGQLRCGLLKSAGGEVLVTTIQSSSVANNSAIVVMS